MKVLHKVGSILTAQIIGDRPTERKSKKIKVLPKMKEKPQVTFQLFMLLQHPRLRSIAQVDFLLAFNPLRISAGRDC